MSHAQLIRRSLIVAGLTLTLARCRDAFEPGASARMAVTPILPSQAALADFGLAIDGVRFIVVRAPIDTIADTTLALPPNVPEIALDLRVPVLTNRDSLDVTILALSGSLPLFAGTRRVSVPTPLPPPEIPLDTYVGPAADSIVIQPRTPFILLGDSLRLQVQGFNGGSPVSQFYVAWTTSDTLLAGISSLGVLRAPGLRSSVRVRARTPSGATDSVTATFTPAAIQLVSISGGGQTDTIGTPLAVPLEVEARAADGLGVGGVAVRFRSLAGGGLVSDTVVVTDASGRARTAATLGALLGLQTFQASASGLTGSPIAFIATALAGPPTQLLAAAGDAQLAVVSTAVGIAPGVRVRDFAGNPVAGVPVTFTVTTGGGGITGAAQTTAADGIATVSGWTLGTAAGSNTLRATAAGLTRTFTATAIASVPARVVASAGDLQSAPVGNAVTVHPAVRVEDQYGNPIAGASVAFSVNGGGGSIGGATQITNAAGVATVGSWTLGTAVGANSLTATIGAVTPVTFTATGLAGVATAIIKLAGDGQSGIVNTALGAVPRVKLVDQFGNPVAGASVAFSVLSGGGSLLGATQVTDALGIAALGVWTLGVGVGVNTVAATAGALSADFSATSLPGLPTTIGALAGDGQSALVNSILPIAPSVIVRDPFNNPVPGISVSFTPSSGGTISGGPFVTDGAGVATVASWTLASLAGTNTLTATGAGLSLGFSATGLTGAVAQLIPIAGDGLSAVVGQSPAMLPAVRALDQFGNPVAGVTVTFNVTAGGGLVTGASVPTNAAGLATLGGWTLGTLAGSNRVTATTGTLTAVFSAAGQPDIPNLLEKVTGDGQTAVVNTALPTAPAVRLVDQYGNGIQGVTVDFFIQVDGGSITNGSVVTDAAGLANPGSWTIANFVATNLLQASASGVPPTQFSAIGIPDAPFQISRVSIDTQTSLINQAVTAPPAVRVADQWGNAVPGIAVDFAPGIAGGFVTPSAITDASGIARATSWTLGGVPGLYTVDATSGTLSGSPVTFSSNAITTTATSIALKAGDLQSDVVASTLPIAYEVLVLDGTGFPVPGVQVHWAADGTGGDMNPPTSLTDATGVASSVRNLGTIAGPQTASASIPGLPTVVFNATALADAPAQLIKRSSDPQTGVVGTPLGAPPVVQVTDQFGNPIAGVPVNFVLAGLGQLGRTSDNTDAGGLASTGTWTLGNLIGSSSVTASSGSLTDAVFTATGFAGAPSAVLLVDGDGQTGPVGQALGAPYRVRVTDQFGNPVAGTTVRWSTTGRIGGGIAPSTVLTVGTGLAAATHTLGNTLGVYSALASVNGLPDVSFNSTAVAGAAAEIIKNAGDAQSAIVNTAVLTPPTVKVVDQAGAPVAGHSVTWAIASGLGTLLGSPTVTTDAGGIATSPVWILGTAVGNNALTATAPGLTGSPVTFTATGIADAPLHVVLKDGNGQSATVNNAVTMRPSVTVRDQFNNPVPLMQVTFSVTSGGGSVTAATPLTNLQGVATVGSWTLGMLAGSNALTASAATAQSFVFSATGVADVPQKLAFLVAPSRSIAGDTIEPPIRVALEDQHGNINLTAQGLVQLGFGTMPDAAAKLLGTQAVAAVGGIAVFPGLSIDSAGIGYTLIAASGNLTSAESGPFDVAGVIAAAQGDRLQPLAAAFDRRTGFVFVPGAGNTLGVLDPSKGQILQFPILQSQPFGVAVNDQTELVYVTTQAGAVVIVDANNPSVIAGTINVAYPARGIAIDDETNRLFVAVDGDSKTGIPPSLLVIDASKREVLRSIPLPEGALPGMGVAYDRRDRLVYVAIPNRGVGVFDPESQQPGPIIGIVGEKGSAETYGVAFDHQTKLVYATNRADSSLSVIDARGLKELDRIRLGQLPEGLGVDEAKGMIYVANSGSNTVSLLAVDPKTSRFVVFATLVVGPAPKAAAVDPDAGRVYVPTFTDDRVRIIQP